MIKIKFLGGAKEVGRSAFLIDSGDKILLDYGVKLTSHETQYPMPVETNMDAIIISHAHLDHSGNLPHLYLESKPLSYMTPPTLDLAKMLWHDTLNIAGLESMDATFSRTEIVRTEKYTFALNYNRQMDITESSSLEFFDAGHILGSAITKLNLKNKTLVYTGDFKYGETRLHSGADLKLKGCDYLITESTYGDREHPPRKEVEKKFVNDVQDVLDRGGHALVASFAVGRSQEIIDILNEYNLNAEIYFDGMGKKASKIYLDYPRYLKNPGFLRKALKNAHWIKNIGMRKKALKGPSVIITTAGMLQGGPILYYLPELYKDKNSKLFLTGYQVKKTPGRTLLETNKINLNGINVELKMELEKYDFSAHPGQQEMLKAINKLSPEKVILAHGDEEVIEVFRKRVKEEGFDVAAPSDGEEVLL